MLNQEDRNKIVKRMLKDKRVRQEITRKNHYWFFHTYLAEHTEYETADFHREMFDLTQDEKVRFLVICAFRGSAKTTIMSLSYPLWAIMGEQKKRHILITSKTQTMARRIFDNLRRELENNQLLKSDMGPFKSTDSKWGGGTLELSKYKAIITVASVEEGIRGIKHGRHRPDLIICDDVEDLGSIATQEGRDKTYDWFNGDLIPAGDKKTKYVTIGNLLHDDALIVRLRDEIKNDKRKGIYRAYPLLDEDDNCLWPGKFPDREAIEAEKNKVADESAWAREYLLKIISEEERVIHLEWIQYYDEFPDQTPGTNNPKLRYVSISVDLATSEKTSAHFTAILTGIIYGQGKAMRLYILPHPVNKRMPFPAVTKTVIDTYRDWTTNGYSIRLCFDSTAYQKSFGQYLETEEGIVAEEFISQGDKRSRLAMTAAMIRNGQILFPRQGAETLIRQITWFGKEKYDDLADAFSMMVAKAVEHNKVSGDPIALISGPGGYYYTTDHTPEGRRKLRRAMRRAGTLRYDLENSDPLGWDAVSREW